MKTSLQPEAQSLTPEPGGAVGLGGRGVQPEALGGQQVAVLGLLHQVAYLGQQPVLEAGQHGGASDHHQVLRQHLPGVDGALGGETHRSEAGSGFESPTSTGLCVKSPGMSKI